MTPLPDPTQPPTADKAGQAHVDETARALLDAVNAAMSEAHTTLAAEQAPAIPTSYRDTTPLPAIGTTPPVPQPGRPPMSQKATDASGLMLAGGIASLPLGAASSLVLWVLGQADPVPLAIGGAAPVALVLAVAVAVRCFRGVHTEQHDHYEGTVVQNTTHLTQNTKGLIAKTTNTRRHH
ncbi:hypothetical protein [Streptomyces sp. Ac-502]|uniref:hypothetical protein n=1 Tax=Streptomyces sp. Ac-502 TaxID=3342801 RepID=UPI0038623ED0